MVGNQYPSAIEGVWHAVRPGSYIRRSGFNCEYLLIANCEFLYASRFANVNVHVLKLQYGPGRLSDSQFGLT